MSYMINQVSNGFLHVQYMCMKKSWGWKPEYKPTKVVNLPVLCSPTLFFSSHTLLISSTERPQPPRKLSVPQDGVEARRLRLHWVMGGSGSSPLRYYTLQVKELPSGDWNTHTADISYNVTTWTVDRYYYAHMYSHPNTYAHRSGFVARVWSILTANLLFTKPLPQRGEFYYSLATIATRESMPGIY